MTKRLLALAVVSLFMLPALMAQTFEFRYHGESLTDGATVTVAAAIDVFDEMSCGTNPYDNPTNGLILKLLSGGQNVNKVESGVRVRYQYKDPYTGEEEEILVENTETRDQPKNRENALRNLKSILYNKELEHRREEQRKIEDSKMKIEWGSQIRSYVFDDRRVKDHRTNYQTSNVGAVMDGDIDNFIKAYLMEFSTDE